MALGVVAWIHRHEAGMLQEARVDASARARETARNTVDDVVLEPVVALVHRQVVHGRGRLARIDRPTHHGHAQRGLFAAAGHQGDSREDRDCRLADAHHMAIAIGFLQVPNEFLHIVDIVVKMKLALSQRNQARVFPVGDVDLVVLEHGLDGVAQQRRVMTRQRRYHQHRGLPFQAIECRRIIAETLEAAQFAKRLVDFHAFMDRHSDAVHIDRANAEFRLFIVAAQPVHQVETGGHALGKGRLAQDRQRIGKHLGGGVRQIGERLHHRALGFVQLVQHGKSAFFEFAAVQYNSSAPANVRWPPQSVESAANRTRRVCDDGPDGDRRARLPMV